MPTNYERELHEETLLLRGRIAELEKENEELRMVIHDLKIDSIGYVRGYAEGHRANCTAANTWWSEMKALLEKAREVYSGG